MNELIGLAYEKVNCWDLVRLFYKYEFGVEVRHYYEGVSLDIKQVRNLIYSNIGDFVAIENDELKYGDLVLMRVYGVESHIAVYIGQGRILHTNRGTGSVIESIEKFKDTISGFYRIQGRVNLC